MAFNQDNKKTYLTVRTRENVRDFDASNARSSNEGDLMQSIKQRKEVLKEGTKKSKDDLVTLARHGCDGDKTQ